MAGTRRPPESAERDAFVVGCCLGFLLGVIVGAWIA